MPVCMHGSLLHRYTGLLAAAALALGTARSLAESEHPFIGIWSGTWPNKAISELTVAKVNAHGQVYGTYCNRGRFGRSFIDLHPDKAVAAHVDDGVLRYRIGEFRSGFRLDAADPDFLEFTHRRGEKEHTVDVARTDEQRCADRYIALTPGADTAPPQSVASIVPEKPAHWLIGTWAGTTPTGLAIELTVTQIDGQHAKGVYCNLRGPGPVTTLFDLHPTVAHKAKVSRNGVKFGLGKTQFEFKKTDDDTMRITRRKGGKKRTYEVSYTDEPACANRVVPLSGP